MKIFEQLSSVDLDSVQCRISRCLTEALENIDVDDRGDDASPGYHSAISPKLALALREVDESLDILFSHLLVRDIHDPSHCLLVLRPQRQLFFTSSDYPLSPPSFSICSMAMRTRKFLYFAVDTPLIAYGS